MTNEQPEKTNAEKIGETGKQIANLGKSITGCVISLFALILIFACVYILWPR